MTDEREGESRDEDRCEAAGEGCVEAHGAGEERVEGEQPGEGEERAEDEELGEGESRDEEYAEDELWDEVPAEDDGFWCSMDDGWIEEYPSYEYELKMRWADERRERWLRLVLSLAFVAIVVAVLMGITWGYQSLNQGESQEQLRSEWTGAPIEEASPDGKHEVIDTEGRTVRVPNEPTAIATLDSFCGELVVMAGAGEQLCGAPGGVKSDVLLAELFPGLDELTTLSGNAVNVEALMAAGCDVALVKPTLAKGERDKLDGAGIPYVVVGYEGVEQQIRAMAVVASVLDTDAMMHVEGLMAYYRSCVIRAAERAEGLEPSERLRVYHSINDALLTDGASSLGADWIAQVGCVDVSGSQEATSGTDYQATLEQVYKWDPDLVICNASVAQRAFLSEPRWQGLRAVSLGNVKLIPTGATRWGQRGSVETYLAMLWLGCTAYPELYADIDLEATVRDYYRTYVGLEITDEQWQQMLAGEGLRAAGTGGGQ